MVKVKAGVAKRSTWKIASESVPTDSFGFNANFKPFMLQNFETNNNGNVVDFPCGCRGSARFVVLLVLRPVFAIYKSFMAFLKVVINGTLIIPSKMKAWLTH